MLTARDNAKLSRRVQVPDSRVGKVIDSCVPEALHQLAPELQDVAKRYGFDKLLNP